MKSHSIRLFVFSFLFISCEKMLVGPEPENNARTNFNILWKNFDENYALFGVKNINWDSLYTLYSSNISENTTEGELWEITSSLVSHLDDAHVNIFNKDYTKSVSASKIVRTRKADDFSLNLVKSVYLTGAKTIGAGFISYGILKNENIGYIHISSFVSSGSGNDVDWAYDIDKAILDLRSCDGLVVDVRNNGGGLIVIENIIISAFIDRKITFLFSRHKTGLKHNDFGDLKPISVDLRLGIIPYSKKIALLTNRFTGSGGEYLTQAFKNLSYSTQIGDTTLGAFGEVTKMNQLPNGWTFRFPCTLTTTPDGNCPEGVGIIPDILIENSKSDIDSNRDRVLEYATEYLLK